jgi:hypothetical protein
MSSVKLCALDAVSESSGSQVLPVLRNYSSGDGTLSGFRLGGDAFRNGEVDGAITIAPSYSRINCMADVTSSMTMHPESGERPMKRMRDDGVDKLRHRAHGEVTHLKAASRRLDLSNCHVNCCHKRLVAVIYVAGIQHESSASFNAGGPTGATR